VAAGCTNGCSATVPAGLVASLAGGYQFSFGFGLGVHAGYVRLGQSTESRAVQALRVPTGEPLAGTLDDALLLQGVLLGGSLWFRRGVDWPITARVNGGILLGSLRTERTAHLAGVDWPLPATTADARFAYVNPELRLGYAVAKYFDLSLVLQAHILIAADKPVWQAEQDLYYEGLGFVDFPQESLTGDVVVLVTPGLGAALSFY
jgi:hypothetical protein